MTDPQAVLNRAAAEVCPCLDTLENGTFVGAMRAIGRICSNCSKMDGHPDSCETCHGTGRRFGVLVEECEGTEWADCKAGRATRYDIGGPETWPLCPTCGGSCYVPRTATEGLLLEVAQAMGHSVTFLENGAVRLSSYGTDSRPVSIGGIGANNLDALADAVEQALEGQDARR